MRRLVLLLSAVLAACCVTMPASAPAGAAAGCTAVAPPPAAPSAAADVDDGLDGVASAPSGGLTSVRRVEAQQGDASAVAADPLPAFATSDVPVCSVAYGLEPLQNTYVRSGVTDSTGVRMFQLPGSSTLYNHPVGQAQLSMEYLDTYLRTHSSLDLQRAERNAQRLIDTHVESRGGWYFPYEFDFDLYGDPNNVFKAPWYSAMAEGQAMQAFVRLYQVTLDPAWRTAADGAFAALNSAPAQGEPSVTWVSGTSDLWFDEYPRWPASAGERVLNGHLWVVFGLYDYYLLTGDEQARLLYDGGMTTIARYLTGVFRTPNWWSKYSALALMPSRSYHHVHIEQLLYAQHETGQSRWATWARLLRSDAPAVTKLSRPASLQPGLTRAYRLDSNNRVIATRTLQLSRSSGAPITGRQRAYGHEVVDLVGAGWLTGWWVPEGYTLSRPIGPVDPQTYSPQLRLTLAPGTVSAYRYTAAGAPSGSKTLRQTTSTTMSVTASAVVDGRVAYLVTDGPLAGYWLPQTSRVSVS